MPKRAGRTFSNNSFIISGVTTLIAENSLVRATAVVFSLCLFDDFMFLTVLNSLLPSVVCVHAHW